VGARAAALSPTRPSCILWGRAAAVSSHPSTANLEGLRPANYLYIYIVVFSFFLLLGGGGVGPTKIPGRKKHLNTQTSLKTTTSIFQPPKTTQNSKKNLIYKISTLPLGHIICSVYDGFMMITWLLKSSYS
jgi:hypothetical protein